VRDSDRSSRFWRGFWPDPFCVAAETRLLGWGGGQ